MTMHDDKYFRFFLASLVFFFLFTGEPRSQNLPPSPSERHHVILCFDANGNGGKIDILSKRGQEKLREAVQALFNRLRQPESRQENRAIFDSLRQDLLTTLYYTPDVRKSRKIRDFTFTRDFIFLPGDENVIAREKLPVVGEFIQAYANILTLHKRNDALNLYKEAASASVLFLTDPQYANLLKPADKIYVINFYSENINLDAANNTLDLYVRSTWPDSTDSPGFSKKYNSLDSLLSPIKNHLNPIEHKIVDHENGLKLHFTMAGYEPISRFTFFNNPQRLKFKKLRGDTVEAEIALPNYLLSSLPAPIRPEYWRLLIMQKPFRQSTGDTTTVDTLAQNFGYWDQIDHAYLKAPRSRLATSDTASLQVTAYATDPLALKARLNNVVSVKISFPSWWELYGGRIISLIVLIIVVSLGYYIYMLIQRRERRPQISLYLEKVPLASRLRIDLNSDNPQLNNIATLKLNNTSPYNRFQKDLRFRYGVASGRITIQTEVFCGAHPIRFKLSVAKPLVGIQVSKDGQTVIVDTHESISIPGREEDEPGWAQRTSVETRIISIQSSLIEDVLDCTNPDEEVDVDLKITARCAGADGAPTATSDAINVPLRLVRQHTQLAIAARNDVKEISYNDSAPQRICDFVFTVPSETAKTFSVPITATFRLGSSNFSSNLFPFEIYDDGSLVDKMTIRKLLPRQEKLFSVFVNWGKTDFKAPLHEGEKAPLNIHLFLEPDPVPVGLQPKQRVELEDFGYPRPPHVFYVTPDQRKPHLSVEIAKAHQDYFEKDRRDLPADAVYKDEVYDVIFQKTSILHPIKFDFDPVAMDLQTGLTRIPLAVLTIHSHRSTPNIGEIKRIIIDFKKKVHADFIQFEIGDERENLAELVRDGNDARYELRSEFIPRGENQKTEIYFYIDRGKLRDTLRAGKLSPVYKIRPAEDGKYRDAEIIELDGKPYELNLGFVVEVHKPGKTPLPWKLDWLIRLSPQKNQFWISIDYGTSAIAAACWNVSSPYEQITELPLIEKWIDYEIVKTHQQVIDDLERAKARLEKANLDIDPLEKDKAKTYLEIPKAKLEKAKADLLEKVSFLPSRMRLSESKSDVRLGQSNFVQFVNPENVDPRWQNMLAPLKTMINEPVINLPRLIDFYDHDGMPVKSELPKTNLVLRSMYYHLFQHYIIPSIKDYLRNFVWRPRFRKLRDQRDRRFVALEEYLARFVITVPNSFTYWHIQKLRTQLESIATDSNNTVMPGNRTEFVFLSESEAVAYYYLKGRRQGHIPTPRSAKPNGEEEYILIYDQGAGTLDLSYIRLTNIFSAGEPKTTIEILSQVGVYAAGNNINYALAEIIEEGIKAQKIKNENGDEITFKPNRSLLPVVVNESQQNRHFLESSNTFNNALLLFHIDLENRYKRTISDKNGFDVDKDRHDEIFSGGFKVESEYVRNKFYTDARNGSKKTPPALVQRMTTDIIDSLFKLSTLPPELRQKGKFPLDRLIFSGRSTAFMDLQGKVRDTVQRWAAKEIDHFAFDETEAKTAVSQGALYYAAEVLATEQTLKAKRLPIFVRYVVRDTENGKPIFRELLSPHFKYDPNARLFSNKKRVSLIQSKDVILYETKKEIDELNVIDEEAQRHAIIEICRVPRDMIKSLSVEVELKMMLDTGRLIFRVDGIEPAEEFICPPPKNEPGYEEGQWPYIFMSETETESTTATPPDSGELSENKDLYVKN